MSGLKRRLGKRIIYALNCMAPLTVVPTITAQMAALQHLTPAQSKGLCCKLDRSPLPSGARVTRYPHQEFLLRAAGAEDLNVIPISLSYDPTPSTRDRGSPDQCGTYLLHPDGQGDYIGLGAPEIMVGDYLLRDDLCDGVLAVGIAHDPGTRPRLIFVLSESTGAGPSGNDDFPVPYILRWSADKKRYEIDANATKSLQYQSPGHSLAAVRRQLAQYDAKQDHEEK